MKKDQSVLSSFGSFDGIRGIAILLVMAHNLTLLEGPTDMASKAVALAFDVGWVGVTLFLVLSGFLITESLQRLQESPKRYRTFFGRRILRILPLVYLALIVCLWIVPLVLDREIGGSRYQIWLWLNLSNWAAPFGHDVEIFPHLWFLGVIVQFYLLWPLAVWHLEDRGLLRLSMVLIAAAIATRTAIRILDVTPEAAYMFTICRMDALALGAVISLMHKRDDFQALLRPHLRTVRITLLLGAAVTFVATRGAPRVGIESQTFGYTLWGLLAAALVASQVCDDQDANAPKGLLTRLLMWRPLVWAGSYSYAAYIIHKPLHHLLGLPVLGRFVAPGVNSIAVNVGYVASLTLVTYLLAYLWHHMAEKHIVGLRRFF